MTDNQESPRRYRVRAASACNDSALFPPGTRVGRYTIERRLGAGAMSEVYLAVDESLGRRAAIIVIGNKLFGNSTLR
jgi:serine/threonine protein kinase